MAFRYVMVTLENATQVRLQVEADTADWLIGVEVRIDGTEVTPRGADLRRHIIDRAAILKVTPLVMNRTYCELEVAC